MRRKVRGSKPKVRRPKIEKNSVIGFNHKNYRSVKFDREAQNEFLTKGRFIKFFYGPGKVNETTELGGKWWKPLIGKIDSILTNGLCVKCDTGYHNPSWDRISRIFLEKASGKIKETRLKAMQTYNNTCAGVLDGAISKIINRIKLDHGNEVTIEDRVIDLTTRYNRTTKFIRDKSYVTLHIEDINSNKINVLSSESDRKSSVKISSSRRVNTFLLIRKIKSTLFDESELAKENDEDEEFIETNEEQNEDSMSE